MTNRIFPIKTEPACLLKWSWSSIYFKDGTTNSCHRTKHYVIDPENFSNFHNVPEKLRDRKKMLEGQWPGYGCQYCRNVEQAGGVSDRQYHLELQTSPEQHPPELNTNPTAVEVTPTILEVWFNNTCNMACVYCSSEFSSKWEEEDNKFNNSLRFILKHPNNQYYNRMIDDMWNYLEEHNRYQVLRRFHILGGEPFLQKELDSVISFWDMHPNINLTVNIISSLNIPHKRFKQYIDKFEDLILKRKVWKIQITASLDAWGKEQEYTRYGLDLSLWEKNFEYLIGKQYITPSINGTLSPLTIKQTPALIEKINHWNSFRGPATITCDFVFGEPIDYSFQTPIGSADDLYMFGKGVFDKDFEKIISLLPTNTEHQQSTKKQIESIAINLKLHTQNRLRIDNLKKYLSDLDFRRNTNWQETFPWLVEL